MENKKLGILGRVTALTLSLTLIMSFAAGCKKDENKKAEESTQVQQVTDDAEVEALFGEDETEETAQPDSEEESADDEEEASSQKSDEKATNKSEEKPQSNKKEEGTADKTMDKAQAIAALNNATAKASKMSYNWKRVCNYTPTGSIDVGSDKFKSVLNGIINGISKGDTIDTVMGDFLGVGTLQGNVVKGKCAPQMEGEANYLLKGMSITAADVKQFKADGDTYYFNLKDVNTPDKNGKNAMHHMTNDFTSPQEMTDLVEGNSGGLIKINRDVSVSEFRAIILKATIKNGELTDLEFSYKMAANPVGLKAAGFTIKGRGEVKVTEHYWNFK